MAKFACLASALLVVAVPALAQAPASPTQDLKKSDVNKVVCQKEEQIGSRLGAKKVCLTVKEWLDRAQLNREETERAQQNTGVRAGG